MSAEAIITAVIFCLSSALALVGWLLKISADTGYTRRHIEQLTTDVAAGRATADEHGRTLTRHDKRITDHQSRLRRLESGDGAFPC